MPRLAGGAGFLGPANALRRISWPPLGRPTLPRRLIPERTLHEGGPSGGFCLTGEVSGERSASNGSWSTGISLAVQFEAVSVGEASEAIHPCAAGLREVAADGLRGPASAHGRGLGFLADMVRNTPEREHLKRWRDRDAEKD